MQRKVILDTSVYIDLFNHGHYTDLINPFQHITYLAYPVLHELWMGLKNDGEVRKLTGWRDRFIRLKRLIVPTPATIAAIGEICRLLRKTGRLDPVYPKHYNDIVICALARQIGAVVFTRNARDFEVIQSVVDFDFTPVSDTESPPFRAE